jgi:hypothetical protein
MLTMASDLPAHLPWPKPDEAALAILALHTSRREWLIRRFDRAVYADDRRIDWDTTFEIHIPTRDADAEPLEPTTTERRSELLTATISLDPMPLPLIVKDRELLKGFDLRASDGSPIRTLTWEETAPLVAYMLVARARAILHRHAKAEGLTTMPELHADIVGDLEAFAGDEGAAESAHQELARLRQHVRPFAELHDKHRQAEILEADRLFAGVLDDLTGGFLVIAVASVRPGEHQTLQLRHREESDGTVELRAGSARSYHAEIRLPRGVAFKDSVGIEPHYLPERPGTVGEENDFWRPELDDDVLAVHAVAAYPQATLVIDLLGSICSPEAGLVERTVWIGRATVAMFVGGLLARMAGIHPDVGAAAPILAAVPAAYALLVLQDSRSRTHEAVVKRPRDVLRAMAVLTFGGSCTLAGRFPARDLPALGRFGWGLKAVAWVALSSVAAALVLWTVTRGKRQWCGTSTR